MGYFHVLAVDPTKNKTSDILYFNFIKKTTLDVISIAFSTISVQP
jgi:hypothetical protein